jgi:hypothetical protein
MDGSVHSRWGTISSSESHLYCFVVSGKAKFCARQDWRILQRRHTFALLASIYESSKDIILQQTILQVSVYMTLLSSN